MAKIIKLPSIPNVSFMEWNTYEQCKMYNSKLTIEEYNKAFGVKSEPKKVEKSEKAVIENKSLKVDLNDKKK